MFLMPLTTFTIVKSISFITINSSIIFLVNPIVSIIDDANLVAKVVFFRYSIKNKNIFAISNKDASISDTYFS